MKKKLLTLVNNIKTEMFQNMKQLIYFDSLGKHFK